MLFHASFPARSPAIAAEAIARLWKGQAFQFPVFPGSYIALENDDYGTCIEIYPAGQTLSYGKEEVQAEVTRAASPTETHLAISTPLTEAEVLEIAADYGWKARTCDRGGVFHVIEFWIEDDFMVEVLTEAMQAEYLAFMKPGRYAAFLEQMQAQTAA